LRKILTTALAQEVEEDMFSWHPGLREFKIVRRENGSAQVSMSDEDDLALFGSLHAMIASTRALIVRRSQIAKCFSLHMVRAIMNDRVHHRCAGACRH
jgi:hypothetical protein